MYNLLIKQGAVEMAADAYEWYEEQRLGLGDLFLEELERCYDRIESKPELYAVIQKGFRQIVMETFPYVVVFEFLDKEVIVYAVFHTSRNPKKKFRK